MKEDIVQEAGRKKMIGFGLDCAVVDDMCYLWSKQNRRWRTRNSGKKQNSLMKVESGVPAL